MPHDAKPIGRVAMAIGLTLTAGAVAAVLWSRPDAWPYVLGVAIGAARG